MINMTTANKLNLTNKSNANTFKIVLIGDSCSGKSSLLLKYTEDRFIDKHRTTIGVDYKVKYVNSNNKLIRLQLWDTAGQERFRSIIKTYYHGTHGIILTFDLTDEESFNNLGDWVKEINEIGNDKISVILIGNKSDLKEQIVIKQDDINDFVENCGIKMKYFECSSKTGENINQSIDELIEQLSNTNFDNLEMEKISMNQELYDFYSSHCNISNQSNQSNQTQIDYYTGCCNVA